MAHSRFQEFLAESNLNIDIIVTQEPTKTAIQASTTHGVPVSNIVKSLLVKVGDEFHLFLVPGDRRLDLEGLKARFNQENIRMADANEVKNVTGYSIGGVPPFGHISRLLTHIEEGFDPSSLLVAAAGSGNSVFKIALNQLSALIN